MIRTIYIDGVEKRVLGFGARCHRFVEVLVGSKAPESSHNLPVHWVCNPKGKVYTSGHWYSARPES